jgi:hypothetical protein
MEDVIYIVLGLLWLVFTFYTQSRKRKQREAQKSKPTAQSSETPKSFFEQIFTEAPSPVELDEEPIPEADLIQTEVIQDKRIRSTFEEEYEKMGIKSLEDTELRIQNFKAEESGKINLEKKHGFESEFESDFDKEEGLEFDLKKAVIMAEILERPYL